MDMNEKRIRTVVEQFAEEVKKIFGTSVQAIILYGSCARGDFKKESDIDIMVLLDVPQEEIGMARKKIFDITDCLDLSYDVVLTPVIQNYQIYTQYLNVSGFYQNVQREGIRIA